MSFIKSLIPTWNSGAVSGAGSNSKQNIRDWTPPKISKIGELDDCRHHRVSGAGKSFRWNAETLGMVVRAFQQSQTQNDKKRVDVKSLHIEICDYVKTAIISRAMALCKSRAMQQCGITEREFNVIAPVIEEQVTCDFDRMASRWIRMPTVHAVQTKLAQCACLALVDIDDLNDLNDANNHDETRPDYEQASVRRIIQAGRVSNALREVWLNIMTPPPTVETKSKSRGWFRWL
jgi:hypothetical protein